LRDLAKTEALPGGALPLRVIRKRFPDYDRAALDAALIELQNQKALTLFEMVDPPSITEADHEAALILEDIAFHTLYLKG
jgi:hypothetical protein